MNNKTQRDHLLWLLMDDTIQRYLMANAEGKLDGALKAHAHIQLSYIYVACVRSCEIDAACREEYGSYEDYNYDLLYNYIHDATTPLTAYMDEVIGFPITGRPNYNTLAPKFFKEFIRLADDAYEKA